MRISVRKAYRSPSPQGTSPLLLVYVVSHLGLYYVSTSRLSRTLDWIALAATPSSVSTIIPR
ncbi:MAG: hypothetical protein MZV63_53425 [Marinilabiliales bacterium]|nr:hypothetical protein [Marinilabiliales bacterium]